MSGKIIAMVKVGKNLSVFEKGINQNTILIEFDSYDDAINANNSSDYQKVLLALNNGADRYIRIFEGILKKIEIRKFNDRVIHFSYDARLSF